MATPARPVHLRHSIDGYPLCWPMDRDGEYDASPDETAVTCPDCNRIVTGEDYP